MRLNFSVQKVWRETKKGADLICHSHARDGMLYAIALNDKAAFAGEPLPFPRVGLGPMCAKLGIINTNPHDALADCIAEAEVYHTLLRMF